MQNFWNIETAITKRNGKLIDSFNRLDMLTTCPDNHTSTYTLHLLTGLYVGGVLVPNPIIPTQR